MSCWRNAGPKQPVSDGVLDASGLLAVMRQERGAELVQSMLLTDPLPWICTVNLSEVVAKLNDQFAMSENDIRTALRAMEFQVHDFDEDLAYRAAMLRSPTRAAGLGLGDRACIALGMKLGVPVVTADRSWATLGLPVEVIVIR